MYIYIYIYITFAVAGDVVAVGAEVNTGSHSNLQWKEGDRVCGLANGGGAGVVSHEGHGI